MGVIGTAGSAEFYNQAAWDEYLARPVCAERNCLSASQDGKPIPGHAWPGELADDAYADGLRKYCTTCAFWSEKIRSRDRGTVITDPPLACYWFNPNHPMSEEGFRGFGGRLIKIEFSDGRIVHTNNLWFQGAVPMWFSYRIRPNARFL